MKIRRLLLVVWFVLSAVTVSAQDQLKLDSLELLLKDTRNDSLRTQVLLSISRQYSGRDYVKAARYAQQAVALADENGDIALEQKAERWMFSILFNISDFKAASVHAYNALKLCELSKDSVGIAANLVNLGAIYDRLEEFDKALEFYLKAQTLLTRIAMDEQTRTSYLTSVYNNIANVYHTKHDFKSALDYYTRSLSLARQSNSKQNEGIALNNLGKLYMSDLKQPDKAFEYLTAGLNIRLELGDKNDLPKSYINLANYYRGVKNFSDARQAANQALSLGREIGSLQAQMDAYHAILLIEKETDHYRESLAASLKFKQFSDSIQKQQASGELAKLQLQYDFEKAEQANVVEKSKIRTRFTIAIIGLTAGLLISVLVVLVIRARARQLELKRKNLAQDVEIKNKELTTNIIYLVRKNELINDVAERLLEIKQAVPSENQKSIQNVVLDLQRETDNDSWKEFEIRFNQVHGDFYEKLRKQYPDLSAQDEKLCAFLRLNMSTKEIAAITKQNVKSLEVARARLRKKMNLTNTASSLVIHLSRF